MNRYSDRVAAFFSVRNRRRKWELFAELLPFTSETTILDVGFGCNEHLGLENFIEKHYPYPSRITALGLEDSEEFRARYPDVRVAIYDGDKFPFEDRSFDVVWSNAVLEHVGTRDNQLAFLREARRVGCHVFITTPNRRFPIEVHTRIPALHLLLPHRAYDRVLIKLKKEWATTKHIRLLSKRDLRELLSEAGFSSYQVVANRLLGFTIDFVIVS